MMRARVSCCTCVDAFLGRSSCTLHTALPPELMRARASFARRRRRRFIKVPVRDGGDGARQVRPRREEGQGQGGVRLGRVQPGHAAQGLREATRLPPQGALVRCVCLCVCVCVRSVDVWCACACARYSTTAKSLAVRRASCACARRFPFLFVISPLPLVGIVTLSRAR